MTNPDPSENFEERIQREIDFAISLKIQKSLVQLENIRHQYSIEKERLKHYRDDELLGSDFEAKLLSEIIAAQTSLKFRNGSFLEYYSRCGPLLEEALLSLENRIPMLLNLGDNDVAHTRAVSDLEKIKKALTDLMDTPTHVSEQDGFGKKKFDEILSEVTELSKFISNQSGT